MSRDREAEDRLDAQLALARKLRVDALLDQYEAFNWQAPGQLAERRIQAPRRP